jgi:hypothetical protein
MQDNQEAVNRDATNQPRPNPANERWLAMRSAYVEYTRASEALESAAATTDDSYPAVHREFATLVSQQRVAFERYLEARLEFLEFRFDEGYAERYAAGISAAAPLADGKSWKPRFLMANPLLMQCVTAGILGLTIIASIYDHRQVRSLEASRDQINLTLGDIRENLHVLAAKLDAPKPAESLQVPAVAHLAPATAPLRPAAQQKPSTGHWRPVTKTPPASRRFALGRSREFKKIGPIEVSLRSVDLQRNSVSLSIVTESGNLHFEHVKPNQPVWINTREHRRSLELIVDRIAKDVLYGRLIETAG